MTWNTITEIPTFDCLMKTWGLESTKRPQWHNTQWPFEERGTKGFPYVAANDRIRNPLCVVVQIFATWWYVMQWSSQQLIRNGWGMMSYKVVVLLNCSMRHRPGVAGCVILISNVQNVMAFYLSLGLLAGDYFLSISTFYFILLFECNNFGNIW